MPKLVIILTTYLYASLSFSSESLYASFEEELLRLEESVISDEVSTTQAAPKGPDEAILNSEDVVIIPLPGMEDDEDLKTDDKKIKRIKSRN